MRDMVAVTIGGGGQAMTGRALTRGQYRAFISYSHADAAFGRRLHRRLERYVLPRRLVGRQTAGGPTPARLAPIFRDRDELPAHHDLTEKVRAALAASDALVVVCSPAAAASRWVAREIETFRELHPDRPVLAALIAGGPAEAFPPALLGARADGSIIEPLAADFRPTSDGARLGLLKLVAGILDVGLDELAQRDAQRRVAQVSAVSIVAVAALLVMGGLTIFALQSRAQAVRQQAATERLIEFMQTDLRDRLESVGRLDILTPANREALEYYEQNSGELGTQSLLRMSTVLRQLGEDDLARGQISDAEKVFGRSFRITSNLLAEDQQDTDRVFAHAQSVFWFGYLAFRQGHREDARRHWTRYLSLARSLARREPDSARFAREMGYAEGNLCTVALVRPKELNEAKRACSASLQWMARAASLKNPPPGLPLAIANREGWLADAYHESLDPAHAMEHRLAQETILNDLIVQTPRDLKLRANWVGNQRGLANLEFEAGRRSAARARQRKALVEIEAMIAFDPSNLDWLDLRQKLASDLHRSQ